MADDVLDRVQAEGELTPSALETGDGNLGVVDDLVTVGISDEGRGEVEGERALPGVLRAVVLVISLVVVVLVVIVLVVITPLAASVRVLVLVPPLGTLGVLLVIVVVHVLVVFRGGDGKGKSREEGSDESELHCEMRVT